MYEFLKEIGLALVEQGPAFFILSVVLGGIGYALHKGAQWWSKKAELWMTRWLNQVDKSQEQVDKLIDENRNDRMLYLESMKKLNDRMDNREQVMNVRLDKQDDSLARIERKLENNGG